jgi:hypothetical protein
MSSRGVKRTSRSIESKRDVLDEVGTGGQSDLSRRRQGHGPSWLWKCESFDVDVSVCYVCYSEHT